MENLDIERRQISDNNGEPTSNWFNKTSAEYFPEDTFWNGNNHVSVNTKDAFHHEALYLTKGGKWVKTTYSNWQGSETLYVIISDDEALTWLNTNAHYDYLEENHADFIGNNEV